MNKLLREVPTMESWACNSSSNYVPVTLDEDFILAQLRRLNKFIDGWLREPSLYSKDIGKECISNQHHFAYQVSIAGGLQSGGKNLCNPPAGTLSGCSMNTMNH